jgi:hypothetical protein
VVERRAGIPADTPAALAYVTSNAPLKPPEVLTEPLRRLYADMPDRREQLQSFVVEETSVPQGTGGINVIDPQILIEAIAEARSDPSVAALPQDYASGYWKARYQALDGLRAWANLSAALAGERGAIADLLADIEGVLARLGFPLGDNYTGCAEMIRETGRLTALLRSEFRWPGAEIDFFRTDRLADRAETFAAILSRAAAVATSENEGDVLLFNPTDLMTVAGYVERCARLVSSAQEHAESKLLHLSGEGDPDRIEAEIVEQLARIVSDGGART